MKHQLNLFQEEANSPLNKKEDLEKIKGLIFVKNFLTEKEESELIKIIDQQTWLNDLARRVQHYGYKYNYRARRIDESMKIDAIPDWTIKYAKRLVEQGFFNQNPDQLIINEYQVGQGISPHIDCEPCFEDTIVSISLNSSAVMNFTHAISNETIPVFLPQRSAVILQKESRYDWKHSIPSRKSDKFNKQIFKRERRISLTFRKVILQ